jgi:hypothetical protein
MLVYERTVKPISIVSERTVGKDTINAGKKQLQENIKCVRNSRKQKKIKIALWPTRINKHLCANYAFKRNLYMMAVVETLHF